MLSMDREVVRPWERGWDRTWALCFMSDLMHASFVTKSTGACITESTH